MHSGRATRSTSKGMRTISCPLSENITTMVNSSATSVSGEIRGMNSRLVPLPPLGAQQGEARGKTREKGHAQVGEYAHGHAAHRQLGEVHIAEMDAQGGRQHLEEQVGERRVEKHLEHRVERHQARAVFAAAFGEVVPHDHHCDAAGQPDQMRPVM